MNSFDKTLKSYFGVVAKSQSYLNLVFLTLSFPLGIFYFVFLVTGISLGMALSIIVIGLAILAAVLLITWGMAAFERSLTISLLHVNIPPMSKPAEAPAGSLDRIKAYLTNPVTWKGLVYLLCRFPLGLLNFTAVVTIIAILVALIATPFAYRFATYDLGFMQITSLSDALLLCIAGLLLAPAGLHALNFLTRLQGEFARIMLGMTHARVDQQPNIA